MKLLYIVNRIDGPGGLERVLSIKTSSLIEQYGYEIHIVTLNQQIESPLFYNFNSKIIHHNIIVYGNPINYILNYRKGIKKTIKKVKPHVVIVCDDGLKGLCLPLIIGKNLPMVYERHVSKNIEIKNDAPSILKKMITWAKFKLMEFAGSFYDKFVVLTNGNKKEWNLTNLAVIPNPLSFYPEAQSTLLNKKVIAVGKQCYQKGYDRLLKAWKLVHEKHPDWVLDIYGTINNEEGLEHLANALNISKAVNFFEPVKNIADKYQEASIYAMSSRFEGFGMVLTEAMAYGVPCVSFNCPHGPSDIIDTDKNGIIVENNDIEALANAIIKLIENVSLRKTMGAEAKKAIKNYIPEKIADTWHSLFKNLIKND